MHHENMYKEAIIFIVNSNEIATVDQNNCIYIDQHQ